MRHPRLIPVLLLIIITSLATPLQAQIVLKGKITTEKNEPVAFAPVILQQLPDTTRYTEGVITDMAGNYRFGKHRAGRYLLSVRTIGYKTLYDTVLLRKPSIGMTEVVRDYVLSEDVAEIDAVVVTANNTASYFDRTVYTITNEDRKAAVTSLDLTNKIPQIRINRQTNQITASDGSVTVLVNGIASSEQELTTLRPEDVRPYDTTAPLYKEYTAEREKHIVFSPRLRELAARLTAGETNPYLKAKRIFCWINDNFPWASAREYSTIENIPEYVLDNRHGDCGQVSLLFITLCRISGIPAHFQSGFMMHPRAWNLHDWAEVYFEGVGWVPVDQSFGMPAFARNADEKFFFLGGIDSWRMIVNTDYGMPLVPEKKYPRSETVDFQRGEVEWEGGNLYFPQWSYHMEIDYLNY